MERVLEHGRRLDVLGTWRGFHHAPQAASLRSLPDGAARCFHSPEGPVTVEVRGGHDVVSARAWGEGARWALDHLPDLLGLGDGTEDYEPAEPGLRRLQLRYAGFRHGLHGDVIELLVGTVLHQLVTGLEAGLVWRRVLAAHGHEAPGPHGLRLPPSPDGWRTCSRARWLSYGALGKQVDTIGRVLARRRRIEELAWNEPEALSRALRSLRGVGPWTVASAQLWGLGRPDAVPVGDYHHPNTVSWALAGEPRGSDARMLELLEPHRPHRMRLVLALKRAGIAAPRYGPRVPIRDIRG